MLSCTYNACTAHTPMPFTVQGSHTSNEAFQKHLRQVISSMCCSVPALSNAEHNHNLRAQIQIQGVCIYINQSEQKPFPIFGLAQNHYERKSNAAWADLGKKTLLVPKQECEEQCSYMCSIHISIRQQNDLHVAQPSLLVKLSSPSLPSVLI